MPKRSYTSSKKDNLKQKQRQKLWCLIIGVSQYEDKALKTLPYAATDCQGLAEAIEKATIKSFPDKEIIVHNENTSLPNLALVRASLQRIVELASEDDTVIFYFSGHGELASRSVEELDKAEGLDKKYNKSENQQAFLCLRDTQKNDLLKTGWGVQEILQMLENSRVIQQLLILDACHSGGLTLRSPMHKLVETLQEGAIQSKKQTKKQKFYALLSCDTDQESWEFEEIGHGLFTYYLINGLLGKAADVQSGEIEVKGLYKYVYHHTLQFIDKLNLRRRLVCDKKLIRGETSNLPPEQPLQTPKLIVEAVGELVLGHASNADIHSQPRRQALVVDGLSDGLTTQAISKILSTAGCFDLKYWHPKVRDLPDVRKAITNCLRVEQSSSEVSTVLLYLRGYTEESADGESWLVIDNNIKIGRTWLRHMLRQSEISQQIVILDCVNSNSLQGWLEDLSVKSGYNQCLIVGASNSENPEEFASSLLKTLKSTNLNTSLSVAEWINGFQRELAESTISSDFSLLGVQGIIEILPASLQEKSEIIDLGICPYMGLKAFSEKDARYFCGRKALTRRLVNEINQKSFLCVLGASGSGKSSVVQAGLIAQLRLGKLLPGSEHWLITSMRPGEKPIQELAKIMAMNNDDEEKEWVNRNVMENEGLLHLGGEGFARWLRTRMSPMVVLIIDQFEELFTLTATAERQSFLDILLEALTYATDRFKLVITVRADFVSPCLEIPLLAQKLQESNVLVPPHLTEEDYRQVIEKPAQQVELKVEPRLVEILLQDLQQSAGDLPLLQFALEQLWEHRNQKTGELTAEAYREKIGGLKGALERKAQDVYNSLEADEKAVAEWLFLYLTQLGEGTEDTRRRVCKSDLFTGKYSRTLVEKTLQKFITAKLIVVNQGENLADVSRSRTTEKTSLENLEISQQLESLRSEVTVEVAHEILIRHWSSLRWWLDENRERLYKQQRLEKKVKEWEQKGKHPEFLLQKTQLIEAEIFVNQYQDYLKPIEREYIQASKKARRNNRLRIGSFITVSLSLIATAGIIAIEQQKQSQLAQLIRYASFNTITPDMGERIFNNLSILIENANKRKKAGEVDKALDDYRQILKVTTSLTNKITAEPQKFISILPHKTYIQNTSQIAENSVAEIIHEYRIPQLEMELKKGNYGKFLGSNSSKFENQFTGALKVSYAVLMRELGAKADADNDGNITEGEEIFFPCKTLKEIEELWRKYTNNRCGWYEKNGFIEQPECRELDGQTLTYKLLFWPPSFGIVENRLQQCHIQID